MGVELGVGAHPTAVTGQVDSSEGAEVLVQLVGEGTGTEGEGSAAEAHDVGGHVVGCQPPVEVSDGAGRVELDGVDHSVEPDLEVPAGQGGREGALDGEAPQRVLVADRRMVPGGELRVRWGGHGYSVFVRGRLRIGRDPSDRLSRRFRRSRGAGRRRRRRHGC